MFRCVRLLVLFGIVSSQKLKCYKGDIASIKEVEKMSEYTVDKQIYCGVIIKMENGNCESSTIDFLSEPERMYKVLNQKAGIGAQMTRVKDRCVFLADSILCVCTHLLLTPCNTPQWLLGRLHPKVTPNVECLRAKVFKILHPNEEDEQVKLLEIIDNPEDTFDAEHSQQGFVSSRQTQALSESEVNKRLGTITSWGPVVMSALTAILICFSIYIIYLSAIFELNYK